MALARSFHGCITCGSGFVLPWSCAERLSPSSPGKFQSSPRHYRCNAPGIDPLDPWIKMAGNWMFIQIPPKKIFIRAILPVLTHQHIIS